MKRRSPTSHGCGLAMVLAVGLAAVTVPAVQAGQDQENPIVSLVRERVADPSKPFVLVIGLKAKEGQAEALEQAFGPAVAATLKEKGCLQYMLSRDPSKPGEYLLFERWSNLDDLRAHLRSAHIEVLLKAIESLVAEPPQAQVLLPVAG